MRRQDLWDADLYDQKHSFVWRSGEDLLSTLAPSTGEHVLDLGCGTGHLTARLTELGCLVVGIDNSEAMIEQARRNYPQLRFEIADGNDFSFDESFDAVFSNAALHWIQNPKQAATCIYRVLVPGGRFVAEFGGRGNIGILIKAVDTILDGMGVSIDERHHPWYFPSAEEYTHLLDSVGFTVRFISLFNRPTDLEGDEGMRNWVRMFGAYILKRFTYREQENIIGSIEEMLRPYLFRDGHWFADYVRLRVVAYRDNP